MTPVASTELDELRARLAELEARQPGPAQGAQYPHTAVLAGAPLHTITPPCDENGFALPGAYNPETGHWEDPETAEKNAAEREAAQAQAVADARSKLEEENKARAYEIARKQLADEQAFSAQVEAAKAELAGQQGSQGQQGQGDAGDGSQGAS